ncbi:MAG: NAD(P)H-binding protein [Betaproteobacteria bacterium]
MTDSAPPRDVLVTGASGYVGRPLVEALVRRRHRVRALCRPASRSRVPAGAEPVEGDAMSATSIAAAAVHDGTLVHLVGTPHPNPSKAAEFENVDLASIRASVAAARAAGIAHLVYVSVAHPAPVMRAYVDARSRGEDAIAASGLTATIVRPWYVLGPGHRWPIVLVPVLKVLEWLPATRESALRLGFVTLPEMVAALVQAVEHPPAPAERRIVEVPAIRAAGKAATLRDPA